MECDIHSNLCNEKYENGIFIDLVYLFHVFDIFCRICGDMPQLDVDNISIWGWVKTLVPSEPQVIAGIYGCSSHYSNVSIGIDPYPFAGYFSWFLHGASRPKDQACWVICFS
jgi:hypothetical protein